MKNVHANPNRETGRALDPRSTFQRKVARQGLHESLETYASRLAFTTSQARVQWRGEGIRLLGLAKNLTKAQLTDALQPHEGTAWILPGLRVPTRRVHHEIEER